MDVARGSGACGLQMQPTTPHNPLKNLPCHPFTTFWAREPRAIDCMSSCLHGRWCVNFNVKIGYGVLIETVIGDCCLTGWVLVVDSHDTLGHQKRFVSSLAFLYLSHKHSNETSIAFSMSVRHDTGTTGHQHYTHHKCMRSFQRQLVELTWSCTYRTPTPTNNACPTAQGKQHLHMWSIVSAAYQNKFYSSSTELPFIHLLLFSISYQSVYEPAGSGQHQAPATGVP